MKNIFSKLTVPLLIILICLCAGCTKPAKNAADEITASQTDFQDTLTSARSSEELPSSEGIDIDSLIGNSFPLHHYRFFVSDGVIKENIPDYVEEDNAQFELWPEAAFDLNAVVEHSSLGAALVEIHLEQIKYAALKLDNGAYIVDTLGGYDIWKDGISVHLSADSTLGFFEIFSSMKFVDIVKTGETLLIVNGTDPDAHCSGIAVFNMDNMRLIEVEDCDEHFREALEKCIKTYIFNGSEMKEDYKFYVSDSYNNSFLPYTYMPGRPAACRWTLYVTYSEKEPTYSSRVSDDYVCELQLDYEYSPEQNKLCVTNSEILYNRYKNTENTTETVSTDKFTGNEDIDSLIGNSFPLSHYRFSSSVNNIINEDIRNYVVEDSAQFKLWPLVEVNLDAVIEGLSVEAGFAVTPVEIHLERIKYKALKLENGVYIINTVNSFVIWKDGESVCLSAETPLTFFRDTSIGFADVMGTGKPQLFIAGFDTAIGYIRSGVVFFDMENMRFLEVEDCDGYIREALEECIGTCIILELREIKEGYKFYVSDRCFNAFGTEPWTENENYAYYKLLYVTYSEKRPVEVMKDERICLIRVSYEYSPERDMLCVADVELVYE